MSSAKKKKNYELIKTYEMINNIRTGHFLFFLKL